MGTSPYGVLVYGYALGGSEDGWKVQEVDTWGGLKTSWWAGYDLDDSEEGAACGPEDEGGAIGGLEEGEDEEYGSAEEALEGAVERLPEGPVKVSLVRLGHHEYTAHALAAWSKQAEWSSTVAVDFPELQERAVREDWDGVLREALRALGLTPVQDQPAWLLSSRYS